MTRNDVKCDVCGDYLMPVHRIILQSDDNKMFLFKLESDANICINCLIKSLEKWTKTEKKRLGI